MSGIWRTIERDPVEFKWNRSELINYHLTVNFFDCSSARRTATVSSSFCIGFSLSRHISAARDPIQRQINSPINTLCVLEVIKIPL